MIDDLQHLVVVIRLKRSGLKKIITYQKEDSPEYHYFRGNFDALAQILAEIEMLSPGINEEVEQKRSPLVAKKWSQMDDRLKDWLESESRVEENDNHQFR